MPIIEGATGQPLLYAGTPTNGTNEVQLLTYTATTGSNVADAGTFTVTFDGYTTAAIAFDATDAEVEAALVALPSIGASGCSVTVAAGPPRVYTVTFDGGNMAKLAVPAMTTTSSLLQGAHPVTVVVTTSVAGVTATGRGAAPGAMLLDTTNGVPYWNAGTALAPSWTTITATSSTTAELDKLNGVTAGTVTASKAVVVGANKNIDTLAIAASGLKIGAGAGTAVTATAAELNTLAGVTAGTAAASKALVADANIDIGTLRNVTATGTVQGASVTATGNLTGARVRAKDTIAEVTVDGAVAVPSVNTDFMITKAGVCAMTLVDPTNVTHDGLLVRFIATTAHAHTLSNAAGSGINAGGAGADIGTFGGAIGDNIVLMAYGGKWLKVSSVNVTLA